jgi:two-component system sensor histidine kinase and response regulator WspE
LRRISQTAENELGRWDTDSSEVGACVAALSRIVEQDAIDATRATAPATLALTAAADTIAAAHTSNQHTAAEAGSKATVAAEAHERFLRVTPESLNRLLGLAGESLVESRWLQPFSHSLLRLKRQHYELSSALQQLREALSGEVLSERAQDVLASAETRALECRRFLSERVAELETFDRRVGRLAHGMYEETLACRMRPFSDGTRAYPRLVRDLGRILQKQVRLEVAGSSTQVDRDILEKLDAPIGHLLRNAVDHGIEAPHERAAAGKSAEGVVRLEARHSAGRLVVVVSDDGAGIDLDKLRASVVARGLATAETAARLSEAELYEFLLLPGFSLAQTVTDISGRGVGLDAVHDMLMKVRGTVRISSKRGKGTQFQLQLPLTLSVVRSLLVEIGGEPYALPLASIVKTVKVSRIGTALSEGRPHFELNGRRVGLVTAHQILDSAPSQPVGEEWSVVVLGGDDQIYGLIVDRLLGERELVVHPFDSRLGKIKDISAGALMEDGSPVLIMDVEDLIRSVEKVVLTGALNVMAYNTTATTSVKRKRVLVIDDSLTVRELERKLLANGGYEVEVAVDGMDGWNAVRNGQFDLVVTDIDMPRMDGIELVTLLKQDPRVKSLPVMIVSYKDRPEDRLRGLNAGADYYLAKGSFQDQALLNAVADLIGEAAA